MIDVTKLSDSELSSLYVAAKAELEERLFEFDETAKDDYSIELSDDLFYLTYVPPYNFFRVNISIHNTLKGAKDAYEFIMEHGLDEYISQNPNRHKQED
jgi:hypothetical protein